MLTPLTLGLVLGLAIGFGAGCVHGVCVALAHDLKRSSATKTTEPASRSIGSDSERRVSEPEIDPLVRMFQNCTTIEQVNATRAFLHANVDQAADHVVWLKARPARRIQA